MWKDLETVYTMEYYSSIKKKQTCTICRDVDGPKDCQRHEVNQKEKNKHLIMSLVCRI